MLLLNRMFDSDVYQQIPHLKYLCVTFSHSTARLLPCEISYDYSICHSFPKLVDWDLKGQCRLKRLLFIILQPLKKQHLQQRSLYTRWSSASEPDPSDTRVSPDICVLILSSHIPRNSKLARASLQASCISILSCFCIAAVNNSKNQQFQCM